MLRPTQWREVSLPYDITVSSISHIRSDIPDLDLYGRYKNPTSPGVAAQSPISEEPESSSSRRTSLSSNGQRPSLSNRSGSASSSRSTSFNLPDEARRGIRADRRERGEEVEEDEMMDEEGMANDELSLRVEWRN
jgi:protein phosphatase inhibitor 2